MFINSKSSHTVIKLPRRSSVDTKSIWKLALTLSLPKSQTGEIWLPLSHPNASSHLWLSIALHESSIQGHGKLTTVLQGHKRIRVVVPIYPPWLLTLSCLVRWGLLWLQPGKQRTLPVLGAPTILSLVNAQLKRSRDQTHFNRLWGSQLSPSSLSFPSSTCLLNSLSPLGRKSDSFFVMNSFVHLWTK